MPATLRLATLAAVAVVALAACSGSSGGAGAPASQPPAPSVPVATPVVVDPTPLPTPVATPAPSGPITIKLETATDHDVTIEVIDDGDHVVAARSGRPGDGASVEFGTLVARNLGPKTVEFTWSDTPGDAELGLFVNEAADLVLVIRPEREAGDAVAFDRVLVVEFDQPVDAAALRLGIQEGLDTAG
jgi:hypothetical protein